MNNYFFKILAILIIIIFSGCQKENTNNKNNTEEKKVCQDQPSDKYLVPIRDVNFSKIKTTLLNNYENHEIEVCQKHFSKNSLAGQEIEKAINEINQAYGSAVNFKIKEAEHKNNFDYFKDDQTVSSIGYIDVNNDLPDECYLQEDLTFAMRVCYLDKSLFSSNFNYFNILAKSSNYKHFTDLSSDNHPYKHGVLHELGHVVGMQHTPNWDEQDQKYISIMQGNLDYLSPLDVAYLQSYYPGKKDEDHRNYVASSLVRFENKKGQFIKKNPQSLYIDESRNLKDSVTNDNPYFYVAWFNAGNLDTENNGCGFNKIFLRDKNNSENILEIFSWPMANMPYLSQDQWQGQVDKKFTDVSGIDFSAEWELVFQTNAGQILDETDFSDNEVKKDIDFILKNEN